MIMLHIHAKQKTMMITAMQQTCECARAALPVHDVVPVRGAHASLRRVVDEVFKLLVDPLGSSHITRRAHPAVWDSTVSSPALRRRADCTYIY